MEREPERPQGEAGSDEGRSAGACAWRRPVGGAGGARARGWGVVGTVARRLHGRARARLAGRARGLPAPPGARHGVRGRACPCSPAGRSTRATGRRGRLGRRSRLDRAGSTPTSRSLARWCAPRCARRSRSPGCCWPARLRMRSLLTDGPEWEADRVALERPRALAVRAVRPSRPGAAGRPAPAVGALDHPRRGKRPPPVRHPLLRGCGAGRAGLPGGEWRGRRRRVGTPAARAGRAAPRRAAHDASDDRCCTRSSTTAGGRCARGRAQPGQDPAHGLHSGRSPGGDPADGRALRLPQPGATRCTGRCARPRRTRRAARPQPVAHDRRRHQHLGAAYARFRVVRGDRPRPGRPGAPERESRPRTR